MGGGGGGGGGLGWVVYRAFKNIVFMLFQNIQRLTFQIWKQYIIDTAGLVFV